MKSLGSKPQKFYTQCRALWVGLLSLFWFCRDSRFCCWYMKLMRHRPSSRGVTRHGFDKKAFCGQTTSGNPPIGDNLAEYPKHVCLISTENIFSDDDLTSQRPALTTVHCAKSANCLYPKGFTNLKFTIGPSQLYFYSIGSYYNGFSWLNLV